MSDPFIDAATRHLEREEGYRDRVYLDHLGYETIGIGRLIDRRRDGRITEAEESWLIDRDPSREPGKWSTYVLSLEEARHLLANDIREKCAQLAADPRTAPAWAQTKGSIYRRVALLSMAFQMGVATLAGFHTTLRRVAHGEFSAAADSAMNSKWARQTPNRARRVTAMLRTGVLHE